MSTVTMQELDLETAELLPARETLNVLLAARGNSSVSSGSSTQPGSGSERLQRLR